MKGMGLNHSSVQMFLQESVQNEWDITRTVLSQVAGLNFLLMPVR